MRANSQEVDNADRNDKSRSLYTATTYICWRL